jgi:hypothetical protein
MTPLEQLDTGTVVRGLGKVRNGVLTSEVA